MYSGADTQNKSTSKSIMLFIQFATATDQAAPEGDSLKTNHKNFSVYVIFPIFVNFAENTDCSDGAYALGMETETINNDQLTSSSYYNEYGQFQAWNGRLNNDKYWATATKRPQDDWIQVDLLDIFTVTGIITQGGRNDDDREWVEELTDSIRKFWRYF